MIDKLIEIGKCYGMESDRPEETTGYEMSAERHF
jgi:hypothetical protein